ncbi:VOC family protein [Streptomyces sp. R-07]|uniref:VOC family protein n=1 Tax=unclassified Streptomyces TaxID=2593676 RepID=UPI00343D2130
MLKNIMYVTVYVTDQERALRFYTEQLGLEKRIDYPGAEGRFLTVAVPGSPLEIVLWPHAASAGQPAEAEPGTAPGPLFLESDDLRADFKVLRDRGVTFDQPEPEDYGFGIRIEAVDPDGNRISLRQRPEVKAS